MREERKLTEWLADYRDSLDSLAPPLALESRLRAEVRRRRRVAVAPWLLAAAAAVLLALGIWIGRSRPEEKLAKAVPAFRVPDLVASEVAAPPAEAAPPPMLAPPEPGLKPRRSLNSVARSLPLPAGNTSEAAIFVLLPGSELLPPAQDLQVLRMRIPRARFQALGWPVINADRLDERVLADVVVGGDGVARAVRLVPTDQ